MSLQEHQLDDGILCVPCLDNVTFSQPIGDTDTDHISIRLRMHIPCTRRYVQNSTPKNPLRLNDVECDTIFASSLSLGGIYALGDDA